MTNLTAPLAHRDPFWCNWRLVRTSDPPLSYIDYLNDYILYMALKSAPPTTTVTWRLLEEDLRKL